MDANVLLRFLTDSPPELAERAARLLERGRRGEISLKVHTIVVAETVWVLESFHDYSRGRISDALAPLLEDYGLKAREKTAIGALHRMSRSNVDFADALLAETALAGEESVASFDRDFRKLGVELYEPG